MSDEGRKRIPERKRAKFTGRGRDHTFLQLRHDLLRSPEFNALSGNAVKALLFLAAQFNGRNNGDFSATRSMVLKAGWRSAATAERAIEELLEAGFVVITRHGHRRRCTLYAVTWLPIDECPGKGLERDSERVPSHAWKTQSLHSNLGHRTPETSA